MFLLLIGLLSIGLMLVNKAELDHKNLIADLKVNTQSGSQNLNPETTTIYSRALTTTTALYVTGMVMIVVSLISIILGIFYYVHHEIHEDGRYSLNIEHKNWE